MPIYKRNNVWYIDIWTESGSRIRQSAGTKNQQEAQRLHDKLKHELWQQAKVGEMPKRLWEEAALRWLHEKKDKKSIQSDIVRLRGLSVFNGYYLHELTREFVMGSIEKIKQGKANATKNRYIALVRGHSQQSGQRMVVVGQSTEADVTPRTQAAHTLADT